VSIPVVKVYMRTRWGKDTLKEEERRNKL